jgi:hypothetical protein
MRGGSIGGGGGGVFFIFRLLPTPFSVCGKPKQKLVAFCFFRLPFEILAEKEVNYINKLQKL